MSKEFVEYMKEKVANEDSPFEAELNKNLLSLYKRGFITVEMQDGEAMISISDEGKRVMLDEVAMNMSMANVGEA